MTKLRFAGRILPEHIEITVQDHPTLHWTNTESGLAARFDVSIEKSIITIDFESNETGQDHIQQAVIRALDVAQALPSLASFIEAEGIAATLDEVTLEDGTKKKLISSEPGLKGLATAIGGNQDMVAVLRLMLTEPTLLLAMRDLSESIQHAHTGAINCGRAVDAICTYFIPADKKRKDGWAQMRAALNVSDRYLRSVTDLAVAPRHGDRTIDPSTELRPAGIKTWKVMNRFLEYRKRGNQPLPRSEFPLLED